MIKHLKTSGIELRKLIKEQQICFGGNEKLKIYGDLKCKSGKRMKKENRVFFVSKDDAIQQGYRPCGHCMKQAYLQWKDEQK
jgi:methylphosphotriester-DNA--protein-cysteine methyltransferase